MLVNLIHSSNIVQLLPYHHGLLSVVNPGLLYYDVCHKNDLRIHWPKLCEYPGDYEVRYHGTWVNYVSVVENGIEIVIQGDKNDPWSIRYGRKDGKKYDADRYIDHY